MSRKIAIYLDTSILNAIFKEPEQRKLLTKNFLNKLLPKFEIYISDLVQAEIEAAPDDKLREQLVNSIKDFKVLKTSAEAEEMANEYMKFLKIPKGDALHIGIASIEGMDYLVTWNMNHIAKENTRRIVDNINFLKGIHRIYIVTPRDFMD